MLVQNGEKKGVYKMIIFFQIFIIVMAVMIFATVVNNYMNRTKGDMFILTNDGWERFDKEKLKWVKAKESDIKAGDRII